MNSRLLLLLCLLLACGAATARPDGAPAAVRQLRIEPSTASVLVGEARLSVEPLTRSGGGLSGSYKVEVSLLPFGNEAGKFTVNLSAEELRQLAAGQAVEFMGQAVSTDGNNSEVRCAATPAGAGDSGALRIHIASKKGKLVFHTTYHLER